LEVALGEYYSDGLELASAANWIAWGMFGLLLFGLAFGILFGAIRGFKRSVFRLVIVIVASLTAFFMTPLFTRPFGRMFQDTLDGWIGGDATFNAAVTNFPELNAVLANLPAAIMGLLVFIVLFYLLRFISWIVYIIFAGKIAPRTTKIATGEKTQNGFDMFQERPVNQRRWLGILVGVAQALVIFFFIWIPVHGGVALVRAVDTYVPEFTTLTARQFDEEVVFNDDLHNLADLYIEVREVNDAFQRSAYGFISRITGMQALGGPMFSYLTTIRTGRGHPNISFRDDVILASEIHKDVLAIMNNFIDEDGDMIDFDVALRDMPATYYNGIRATIRKIFEVDSVRLVANAGEGFAGFIDEIGLFDDVRIFNTTDELNERFNDALINTIASLNANRIRNELINVVNIVEVIFTNMRHYDGTDEYYNIFETFRAIADNWSDENGLTAATSRLESINGDTPQDSLVYAILTPFFNSWIFAEVLSTAGAFDTIDILRIPLMVLLDLDENDIDFPFTWQDTAYDISRIVILSTDVLGDIADLVNAGEDFLDVLAEDMDVDSIGEILNILTMEINFAPVLQLALRNLLADIDFDFDLVVDVDIANAIDEILDALEAGDIDWIYELRVLQSLLQVGNELINFDPNTNAGMSEILDIMFGSTLLENLEKSVLARIVVEVVHEALNDMNLLGGILGDDISISVDFSAGGFAHSLEALQVIADGMVNLITGMEDGSIDPTDIYDIIDALESFGNELLDIANINPSGNSPVTIYLEATLYANLQDALIAGGSAADVTQAQFIIGRLFASM